MINIFIHRIIDYIKQFALCNYDYLLCEKSTKLYIYLACEGNSADVSYFIEINQKLIKNGESSIQKEKNISFMKTLTKEFLLVGLNKYCKEHKIPKPTEIKIIYDCVNDTFETAISYDKHFRVRKPTIGPYEIFNKWFEDTKKEYEEKYGKQDES
jgi:hypothetical protein